VECYTSNKPILVQIWITVWIWEFLDGIFPLQDSGSCKNFVGSAAQNSEHARMDVQFCIERHDEMNISKLGPKIGKRDMKQLKIVTVAPSLLCDYKPTASGLFEGRTNVVCNCCYNIVRCSVSVCPGK